MAIKNLSVDQGQSILSRFIPSFLIRDALVIGLIAALAYATKRFLKAYFSLIVGEYETKKRPSGETENRMYVKKNALTKSILYFKRTV